MNFILLLVTQALALNLSGLDQKIRDFTNTHQPVPNTGIAVGVITEDGMVSFYSQGFANRETQSPIDQTTLFRIASNTKPFLATAVASHHDSGELKLEDPIQVHLPSFQLENDQAASQASFEDLLSHRVGLPRHDPLWYFTPFSRDELFGKLSYLEMNKSEGMGFRGRWQYNNLMYMTAGLALEHATQKSWQQAIRERILNPLRMESTTFGVQGLEQFMAQPYYGELHGRFNSYHQIGPAGVMVSNARDLGRWVGSFIRGGEGVLRAGTLARMLEPLSRNNLGPWAIEYGLGWFLHEVADEKLVWHGGNIDGYSSHVSFMPEHGVGLVILVNQNGATSFEFPDSMPREDGSITKFLPVVLYEHLLGIEDQPSIELPVEEGFNLLRLGAKVLPTLPWENFLAPLQGFAQVLSLGIFEERAYGLAEVVETEEEQLQFRYYSHTWTLTPTENTDEYLVGGEFAGIFGGQFKLKFDGETLEVPFELSVSPIVFKKN